ncbi:AAA family ATPase [Pelagibacterium luteolum]|uniref:ATP-dependent Zn proteases n=1 Tax=Pelagibacterium luteolum TaxID=440168 RepID=A0A1G7XVN2_9HYPH|nr:AAA family ATPase [Pelagibacterium luteolum]SDG88113.1 ATP-dependent Zn proteases [Pelagibacterium luteolum]
MSKSKLSKLGNPAVDDLPASSALLAEAMVRSALTPGARRLLKARAKAILFLTPSPSASLAIENYLDGLPDAPRVQAITELRKRSSASGWTNSNHLAPLLMGQSVVLVTHDKAMILDDELAALDGAILVAMPRAHHLRGVIKRVTGENATGLGQHVVDKLEFTDIVNAIRPGQKASACVANLKRAAKARTRDPSINPAPLLSSMALTEEVKSWTDDMLVAMKSAQSSHACDLPFSLLGGAPGTGKTTIAASLAKSAGWDFLETSVGKWFETSDGNLGGVSQASGAFFTELAKSKRPVVGLIDEIDAIPNRASLAPRDLQWWTPVVTLVLLHIDKLKKLGKPILLVGASNFPERLDGALVRPGRLERRVQFNLPNQSERYAMLKRFLAGTMSDSEVSIIADLTAGATPARLKGLAKAALDSATNEGRVVQFSNLRELIVGNDKPEDLRGVAIHEAGHAVVALELGFEIETASILKSAIIDGHVKIKPDKTPLNRLGVERLAVVMLAGRAADVSLGNGADAGAAADLDSVNRLLLDGLLGFGLFGTLQTRHTIDIKDIDGSGQNLSRWVGSMLQRLERRAEEIIEMRQKDVRKLADALIDERVMDGDRVRAILGPNETPQLSLVSNAPKDGPFEGGTNG